MNVITRGAEFTDLRDRINDRIKDMASIAVTPEDRKGIEAAEEVALVIQNYKNAYDEEGLKEPIEKTSAAFTNNLASLKGIIEIFENVDYSRYEEMKKKAQELKIKKGLSSVEGVTCKPVVAKSAEVGSEVIYQIHGNFKNAIESNLTLGDKTLTPLGTSTPTRLDFQVPVIAQHDKFSYSQATLNVTNESGYLRTCPVVSKFDLWLNTLPASPGRLQAYMTAKGTELVKASMDSEVFHATGKCPQELRTKEFTVKAPENFLIDTEKKPEIKIIQARGKHNTHVESYDDKEIKVKCELPGKTPSEVAAVSFTVRYKGFKTETKEESSVDDVNLTWGDSKTITVSNSNRLDKLVYTNFNGEETEIKGEENPYVKLRHNAEGDVVISTDFPS